MSVKIGSARINEKGTISGGKPGDQTGNEVGTQSWYLHSKGWRVLRCKDSTKAEKIAQAMQKACDNKNIGYGQSTRNTLYNNIKDKDFDPSKTTKAVDTDCSALVRVCCNYAGIPAKDFITSNEASVLLKTGYFTELKDTKYTKRSDYLGRGDILVTRTKGHTVIVLSNGPKYEGSTAEVVYKLGDRELKDGSVGPDVIELQTIYVDHYKFDLGNYGPDNNGIDGEYGSKTVAATKKLQQMLKVDVDGIFGQETYQAMMDSLSDDTGEEIAPDSGDLIVTGNTVNIRSGFSTDFEILLVARKNDKLKRVIGDNGAPVKSNGWYAVNLGNDIGWISGKYVK